MDVDPTPGASGLLPTEDVDMEEGTVEKGEEGEDEVPPPPPMPDLNTPEDAIAYWSSSMEKVSFVEKKIWFGRTLQARVVIFLLFFFRVIFHATIFESGGGALFPDCLVHRPIWTTKLHRLT